MKNKNEQLRQPVTFTGIRRKTAMRKAKDCRTLFLNEENGKLYLPLYVSGLAQMISIKMDLYNCVEMLSRAQIEGAVADVANEINTLSLILKQMVPAEELEYLDAILKKAE